MRPPTFETVGYDEAAMAHKFGQNVIYANLADIVDAGSPLADDDPPCQAAIAERAGDFPQVTVAETTCCNAAKFELALADFFAANKLSAMAVQCWPSIQRLMGISVCAIYGRLTDQGMLTACETDVLGALAMLVTYQAALGETLPHFIDWTIQHRENPNWLLAWHCGNAPVSLAADPAQTALRSRKDMTGALPTPEGDPQAGLYQFQIKPGRSPSAAWPSTTTSGRCSSPPARSSPRTRRWPAPGRGWRCSDHAQLYRTLVEEGFIHHASMIHGDQVGGAAPGLQVPGHQARAGCVQTLGTLDVRSPACGIAGERMSTHAVVGLGMARSTS